MRKSIFLHPQRVNRTLLNFAYTKTFGQWAPLLEIIASYLYPRPKRKFEYHFQPVADHTLIHYYPFTNFHFDNHRISKYIYNDPEPNQPIKKVRTTYSSNDPNPTRPPTVVRLTSYPSESDSDNSSSASDTSDSSSRFTDSSYYDDTKKVRIPHCN